MLTDKDLAAIEARRRKPTNLYKALRASEDVMALKRDIDTLLAEVRRLQAELREEYIPDIVDVLFYKFGSESFGVTQAAKVLGYRTSWTRNLLSRYDSGRPTNHGLCLRRVGRSPAQYKIQSVQGRSSRFVSVLTQGSNNGQG